MLTAKMVGGSADGQTCGIPLAENGYPRRSSWVYRIAVRDGSISYYFDYRTPRDEDGLFTYRPGICPVGGAR
jgi:hypothetical protein